MLEIIGTPTKTSRVSRAALSLLLASSLLLLGALPVSAGVTSDAASDPVISAAVAEASRRFGLPSTWIWAVIAAESHGQIDAVSPKGAMGLMQLMPGTWRDLRAQLSLGPDPFDRRDNILAGSAYLAELHRRFGAPGFLAAYHAGPGRYLDHRQAGRPLPPETRAYVTGLSASLAWNDKSTTVSPPDWRRSALFPRKAAPLEITENTAPDRLWSASATGAKQP